jgi:hypothetical protein
MLGQAIIGSKKLTDSGVKRKYLTERGAREITGFGKAELLVSEIQSSKVGSDCMAKLQ